MIVCKILDLLKFLFWEDPGGTLYTMAYSGRHPPHGKGYLFWASDERVGVEVYERVGK